MKIYLFDHLDEFGKARYQAIEIDDQEAEKWVQIEYERTGIMRTAQQIQDDIDREFINSCRKEYYQRGRYSKLDDSDPDSPSIVDTVPDSSWTPEEVTIYESILKMVHEGMNKAQADIFICVGLEDEDLSEYAERNGLTYEAAKKLLQRAREKAKKIFKEF